jgi:anti-sigma regulatory factor (Ser/Thr protein kinase)
METLLSMLTSQVASVGGPSEIAAARRAANEMARRQGFSDLKLAQVALVVTEAATNIAKYAGGGEVLIRPLQWDSYSGIEILAIDTGPGISDLSFQRGDGQSTAGTYGLGLGSIDRLSQEFAIYTQPGQGTVMRMVLWDKANSPQISPWQIGAICLPMAGEQACGDAWAVDHNAATATLLLADGLGHGPAAAEASEVATQLVYDNSLSPGALLEQVHLQLRNTRGAAVAIAQIDGVGSQITFAGVGNISACVYCGQERRHLISHNGIAGSNLRKITEFRSSWQPGSMVIAHSDGLNTRWNLDTYPGLAQCHPGLIAGVLYRDFKRERDDVSVVVLREQEQEHGQKQGPIHDHSHP